MTDIKTLNDNFRKTFIGGTVVLTQGIKDKADQDIAAILSKIVFFNDFTEENDPYGEHDFGKITYKQQIIYWKIDYYDETMQYLSENPSNPEVTNRVMTVMLAEEY